VVAPDVYAHNRVSIDLDTGKGYEDYISKYEVPFTTRRFLTNRGDQWKSMMRRAEQQR